MSTDVSLPFTVAESNRVDLRTTDCVVRFGELPSLSSVFMQGPVADRRRRLKLFLALALENLARTIEAGRQGIVTPSSALTANEPQEGSSWLSSAYRTALDFPSQLRLDPLGLLAFTPFFS